MPVIAAIPARDADAALRTRCQALFAATYRDADADYLARALERLRFLATATAGDVLAGFALGEMRSMDLPRLPAQAVALAGICCVEPAFRRTGLFRRLEQAAFAASGLAPAPRLLACGRVAHPASFRTMTGFPSHVPKRGVPTTPWQRAVGAAVAAAYGVAAFDPATFVCRGAGRPVGWPVMEMDVAPEEWDVFGPVDRARGDVLLGLCWMPDAPPGWDDQPDDDQ